MYTHYVEIHVIQWLWEEIILDMGSANERWCYFVTSSLIGWAHTKNDPGGKPYKYMFDQQWKHVSSMKCKYISWITNYWWENGNFVENENWWWLKNMD